LRIGQLQRRMVTRDWHSLYLVRIHKLHDGDTASRAFPWARSFTNTAFGIVICNLDPIAGNIITGFGILT
jgi:hypothetical protein